MALEWKHASVDLGANITTIEAVPCLFKGYAVTSVTSAHVCLIQDSTTPIVAIPASSAAGAKDLFDEGVRFETSLIVDPDDAATGTVSIFYVRLRDPR